MEAIGEDEKGEEVMGGESRGGEGRRYERVGAEEGN